MSVRAQDAAREGSGTPVAPDVYINDSFEAADAIAAARKKAAEHAWVEAAQLMQRAALLYGDRLIPSERDVYITIREHVNNLVCAWPEEGVAAYRELFERELASELEQAAATAPLDDEFLLFERYFCTIRAAELADQLAQAAIESGDFAVARRIYVRVLKQHPSAARYADRYRGMLALVAVMSGADATALPDYNPDLKIRWLGEERRMGEVISAWAASYSTGRESPAAPHWPLLGGNLLRNQRAGSQVDELGLLWRFTGLDETPPPIRGRDVEDDEEAPPRDVVRGLSIQPVARGGLLFLQNRREVLALQRNTGFVAWRFRAEGPRGGIDDLDEHGPASDSVTVAEGCVFASLPGDSGPYAGYDGSRTSPELVCLDAATGRVVWRVGQETLGDAFSEISFDTSPLVDRGRVFVIARRRRSFGFEDAYLLRLSAGTGAIEFRTHLGSASTGSFGFKRATTAMPALDGDVVYACTNLGTLAAVSADTGTVRWLRLYPRDTQGGTMESSWNQRTPSSWAFNPVLVSEGRLFARPLDASAVLVVAADDGRMLRSIPAKDLGGAETLLGVHQELLCTAGTGVSCYDVTAGGVAWMTELGSEWRLSGRGVWVEEKLFLPTRAGLCTFKAAGGERRDIPWDAQGHSGNLLALPEQLFVVADSTVSSYVRKTDLWNALRARMTALRHDPLPALEFAEIALRGGDHREAWELLQEAVRRVEAKDDPPDPPLRRRLFDNALRFAEIMGPRGATSVEQLTETCHLAERYAPDAAANLDYRLRCGALFEATDRPAAAVALYQQILRDRSVRALTVETADPSVVILSQTGGSLAQGRIASLIEKHGAALFVPYETEARHWLDSGRSARDADALTRVVETFPNSAAAAEAVVVLAELDRDHDRFTEAAQRLTLAFHRYGTRLDRPKIVALIADSYARAGRTVAAYRWATRGMRDFPEARVERGGFWTTFRELREQLAVRTPGGDGRRPRIAPPLTELAPPAMPDGGIILTPRYFDAAGADWSTVYLAGADGIHACAAATGKPRWDLPATVRSAVELLVAHDEYLLLASRYEVFALDAATGTRRWTYGRIPDHVADPNRDWEEGGAFTNLVLQDDQLITVRDNGRMSSVSVRTGEETWVTVVKMHPAGRVCLADPWVVYHALTDGPTVLCQVNASTGEWIGVTPTDEVRPVEELFVALDGQVILMTSQSIASYDVDAGVRRWRVNLDAPLRQSSLRLEPDAVYFAQSGLKVRKISLADGAQAWESSLLMDGEEEITIDRHDGMLLVSSRSALTALSESTGEVLWKGTTPPSPRFIRRMLGDRFAVFLHQGEEGADSAFYFYDLRAFSGVIPAEGGVLPLGVLEGFRNAVLYDGSLVLHAGQELRWWGP